jgi:hypothetical protein
MKVILAGSRNISTFIARGMFEKAIIDNGLEVSEVVSGMARGADLAGCDYAALEGIPIAEFPADWDRYGKSAGYIRNSAMAQYADALVAVWDGKSRGTLNMINIMQKLDKKVIVVRFQ